MSQSSIIAGMILAAFILWLAVNDRLTAYTGVLWGATTAPKPTGPLVVGKDNSGNGGSGIPPIPGAPPSSGGGGLGATLGDFLKTLGVTTAEAALAG